MRVSVAIPVYNEERIVPELLRRVRTALQAIPGGPHEILIVDDGSTDGTLELLKAEAHLRQDLNVIALSRNFGHQQALTAALDHVSGDVAILMDGDLQDPPEAIPLFLEKYAEGYDVVYSQRRDRKESRLMRLCYFLFYRLVNCLSGLYLPLDAGDFGLLSRRAVDELRVLTEQHRYLRGLRTWIGFRQAGIAIERSKRAAGKPQYTLRKLLRLASDGIFSFSIVPLRLATVIGAMAILVSSLYAAYAVYARVFLQQVPQGFTTLIIAITFLAGVEFFFMGVIGEYVGRIYEASKGRPIYIVSERFGSAYSQRHASLVSAEEGQNS